MIGANGKPGFIFLNFKCNICVLKDVIPNFKNYIDSI